MYNATRDFLRRQEEKDSVTATQPVWPLFLGLLVNYFLWGIQVMQSYYYYRCYRKTDRAWLKATVGLLFIVDAIQSIFASEGAWNAMDSGGNAGVQSPENNWGLKLTPFMDAITASIVYSFYAQKIWKLLGVPFNYIFTGLVLSLSLLQLVAGLANTVFSFLAKQNLAEFRRLQTWSYLWLVTASITDIIITSLITWKLANSRTGYKETNDIISKLIRFIVETGLTTTILQLVTLGLSLRWPLGTYELLPAIISAKIYSNSMLALLNSRQPRGTGGIFHIHDRQTIGTIVNVHTTQSVDITSDYELSPRQTSKAPPPLRSPNEKYTAPDAESVHTLPFRTTVPV